MGSREEERENNRDKEFKHIAKNLDVIGNPYDQMDIETKKVHALSMYYDKVKVMLGLVILSYILVLKTAILL